MRFHAFKGRHTQTSDLKGNDASVRGWFLCYVYASLRPMPGTQTPVPLWMIHVHIAGNLGPTWPLFLPWALWGQLLHCCNFVIFMTMKLTCWTNLGSWICSKWISPYQYLLSLFCIVDSAPICKLFFSRAKRPWYCSQPSCVWGLGSIYGIIVRVVAAGWNWWKSLKLERFRIHRPPGLLKP